MFITLKEAAKQAKTDSSYLYKLIKAGELAAKWEPKGKLKKWYIHTDCPRYQKLLKRLDPKNLEDVKSLGKDFDWQEWRLMCRRGEEVTKRPCSLATMETYEGIIKKFFKKYPTLNRQTLRAALVEYEERATDENDYLDSRRKLYFAMMTVARYMVYLQMVHATFVQDLMHLYPKSFFGRREPKRRCHTEEDIFKIIDRIQNGTSGRKNQFLYSAYNKALNVALILTSWYTAIRVTEMVTLKMSNLDLKNNEMRVLGKNRKWRKLGIPQNLKPVLLEWLEVRPKSKLDLVFLNEDGGPLNRVHVYVRLRRAGVNAAKEFSPHDARRSSITHMLVEKELPLIVVRDIAGHEKAETTNIYARPSSESIVEIMKRL